MVAHAVAWVSEVDPYRPSPHLVLLHRRVVRDVERNVHPHDVFVDKRGGRVLIERLLYHEDTEETAHDPSDSPSSRRSAGEGLSGSESQRSMF